MEEVVVVEEAEVEVLLWSVSHSRITPAWQQRCHHLAFISLVGDLPVLREVLLLLEVVEVVTVVEDPVKEMEVMELIIIIMEVYLRLHLLHITLMHTIHWLTHILRIHTYHLLSNILPLQLLQQP